MISWIKRAVIAQNKVAVPNLKVAAIVEDDDTGYYVLYNGLEQLGVYSRRRDAVRGAKRRGLELA